MVNWVKLLKQKAGLKMKVGRKMIVEDNQLAAATTVLLMLLLLLLLLFHLSSLYPGTRIKKVILVYLNNISR